MNTARWGKREDPWIVPSRHAVLIVFAFLFLKIITIYLYCTLRADGSTAVLWLDPSTLGLSLEQWLQSIHALLGLWLLLAFAVELRDRLGPTRAKRLIALCFALLLLAGSSRLVSAWADLGRWELEQALQQERDCTAAFERIRASRAAGSGPEWTGIYEGAFYWSGRRPGDGWSETLAVSLEEGLVRRTRRPDYRAGETTAQRIMTTSWGQYPIQLHAEGFELVSRRRSREAGELKTYLALERDGESWLVPESELSQFDAGAEPFSVGALRRVE